MIDQNKKSKSVPSSAENVSANYGEIQPVTDIKSKNYELARLLSPADKKLIGYEVVSSPSEITQYGSYAADFWTTRVSAGIYPIFAKEYAYNEALEAYTNQIKDFNGLFIWKHGLITSSSFGSDIGKPNIVFETPYAHSIAHIVLENPRGKIHLLPPFRAQKIYFNYDSKVHHTYQIIDTSLPDLLETNPMKRRNRHPFDTLLKNASRFTPLPEPFHTEPKIK